MRVALITLFERLILALSQLRKGPNKTVFIGVVQPLLDGVKLLLKRAATPAQAMSVFLVVGALWGFCLMVFIWVSFISFPYHGGVMLCCWLLVMVLGLGVYGLFISGFRGISKYGVLGGMRGCVQRVRYEVSFALIVLSFVMFSQRSFFEILRRLFFWGIAGIWLVSHIAETNRAPIDFAEGESELIRGLNIEYRRLPFALIFVGEYGIVLFLAWLSRGIFWGGRGWLAGGWVFFRLVVRRTFPRFRYDKLLSFCWTRVLPVAAFWVFVSLCCRKV